MPFQMEQDLWKFHTNPAAVIFFSEKVQNTGFQKIPPFKNPVFPPISHFFHKKSALTSCWFGVYVIIVYDGWNRPRIRGFLELRRVLDDIICYLSFFICHKNCHNEKSPWHSLDKEIFSFWACILIFDKACIKIGSGAAVHGRTVAVSPLRRDCDPLFT